MTSKQYIGEALMNKYFKLFEPFLHQLVHVQVTREAAPRRNLAQVQLIIEPKFTIEQLLFVQKKLKKKKFTSEVKIYAFQFAMQEVKTVILKDYQFTNAVILPAFDQIGVEFQEDVRVLAIEHHLKYGIDETEQTTV